MVAVAFRPLRGRVQDAVDRRFSRARYDALRRIASFLEDLRAGRAAPEQIEPVLREVLSDPGLELRFFLPESELYVDSRERPVSERRRTDAYGRPLRAPASRSDMVVHDPIDEERPGLLEEVVEAAGLAIEIARLRVELRRQLDEVEASRARIVSAGYEERRRIERDLHDGAQQRLVSVGLALRHAQRELRSPERPAGRSTARSGTSPLRSRNCASSLGGSDRAQLDEGLAAALRDLAARAPLRVEVEGDGRALRE